MKAIITSIVLTLLTIVSSGQSQIKEHLIFKGIAIDGTLNSFVSKLKQSGLTLKESKESVAILEGDFAGYKDCIIGVSSLKGKDLVHKVVVFFPYRTTWSALSTNYYNLRKLLSEKYGEPTIVTEQFSEKDFALDDNMKMLQVQFDNCKYKAVWSLEKGEIQLLIDHSDSRECFVTLVYFDNLNSEEIRNNAKGDL